MLAEAKAGVVEGQQASPALTVPVDLPEVQAAVADVAAPPVVPSDLPEPLLPNFSRAVTKQDSRAPLPAPVEDPALMTMRGVGLAAQVNAELARRKSALSAPAVDFDVPPPPKERPRVPPADVRAPTAAVPPLPGKSAPKPSLAKRPVMTGQAPVAPEPQRAQAPTSPDPTAQTVDLEPSSSSARERAARAETLVPSRIPNQDQAARRDPSTESASSNTTLIVSVAAGIVLFVAGVVAVYTLLG